MEPSSCQPEGRSEEKIDLGVYVGRFQPLTNAHLEAIVRFLIQFQKLIVLIGSHGLPEFNEERGLAVNPKNPYNTVIRSEMILVSIRDYLSEHNMDLNLLLKLHIHGIHDSNHKHDYAPQYDFSSWNSDFHSIVGGVLKEIYPVEYSHTWESFNSHFSVSLCGCGKDKATQDYLRKIRLGSDGSDGTSTVVGVNYSGNTYLREYLIDPICVSKDSSQTVDATTIRALITRINAGEVDQMLELKKWVPVATILVLQKHEKLIKFE